MKQANRFYGGLGLAKMIAELASQRAERKGQFPGDCRLRDGEPDATGPVDRGSHRYYPASREYYAICDRIARGEKP